MKHLISADLLCGEIIKMVNPYGLVQVSDFGNPRSFTGVARETISGGQFVGASGATARVSSGADSLVSTDIGLIVAQGGSNFVGVALDTVTSGNLLSVAVDGIFITDVDGSVFAGYLVKHAGGDAIQNLGSQAVPADAEGPGIAGNICGRALTEGASGGFAVVYMHA